MTAKSASKYDCKCEINRIGAAFGDHGVDGHVERQTPQKSYVQGCLLRAPPAQAMVRRLLPKPSRRHLPQTCDSILPTRSANEAWDVVSASGVLGVLVEEEEVPGSGDFGAERCGAKTPAIATKSTA